MSEGRPPVYKWKADRRLGDIITKDGHTMFFSDVAKELNERKYLFADRDELKDKIKTLEAENKQLKEFIGEDIKKFVSGAFKKEEK